VESQKALEVVELHSFVGRVACQEQVIPWLYHPSKAHEQRTVYAHGCNPEKRSLAEELQAMCAGYLPKQRREATFCQISPAPATAERRHVFLLDMALMYVAPWTVLENQCQISGLSKLSFNNLKHSE
jgi:hypothetical protein